MTQYDLTPAQRGALRTEWKTGTQASRAKLALTALTLIPGHPTAVGVEDRVNYAILIALLVEEMKGKDFDLFLTEFESRILNEDIGEIN